MKERKVTISMAWANVFSIILLIVAAVVMIVVYRLLWGDFHFGDGDRLMRDVVLLVAQIIVH